MIWLIISVIIFTFISGLLLAPMVLFIDTRIATIYFKWAGIGGAIIVHEKNKWWFKLRVLFFTKEWNLEELITKKNAKKKTRLKKNEREKKRKKISFRKILHLLKTFKVTRWQVALDTGDNVLNAKLYPLNFFAPMRQHLFVNFSDRNYLTITIKNIPAKMIYAWLKY